MDFGYDGCQTNEAIKLAETIYDKDIDYFLDIMKNENHNDNSLVIVDGNYFACSYIGFVYNSAGRIGAFITSYDQSCRSPAGQSWELYLAIDLREGTS